MNTVGVWKWIAGLLAAGLFTIVGMYVTQLQQNQDQKVNALTSEVTTLQTEVTNLTSAQNASEQTLASLVQAVKDMQQRKGQ